MTNFSIKRSHSPCICRGGMQFLILWLVLSPICAMAEFLVGAEYDVKMGFIYNFAGFVTWPPEAFNSSDNLLQFCFASDHPAANVLFQLNDQPIQGRTMKVRKVESEINTEQCHILFFGTDNKTYIRHALAMLRGQHVLTIGEVDGFARMGGVINFFNQNNKLRFEVNIDAAQREDLKFSAQILQSAQRIVRETEEDRKAQQAEIIKLQKQAKPPSKGVQKDDAGAETGEKDASDKNRKNEASDTGEPKQAKEDDSSETGPGEDEKPSLEKPVEKHEQAMEKDQPNKTEPAGKVKE
jgi:hypothetical protein